MTLETALELIPADKREHIIQEARKIGVGEFTLSQVYVGWAGLGKKPKADHGKAFRLLVDGKWVAEILVQRLPDDKIKLNARNHVLYRLG